MNAVRLVATPGSAQQTGVDAPEPLGEAALETLPVPRRIGLLGGTFDPPHLGHLVLAMLAVEALSLDRVLFIPAGLPPHKQDHPISSATDRLLMTRLAIAGDPLFELSPIEIERPGPSFTIDTVGQLRELYGPDVQLFLLMAADSLAQVDSWREPDRLLGMVEFGVGPRPGAAPPVPEALRERFGELAARIHLFDGPALAISSSELRRRVAAGLSIRYLVPAAVEEQIVERRLYWRR